MSAFQRTVREAVFDLPRGRITIEQLMAMEQARWEHIRSEINLQRRRDPGRPLARCLLCDGPVFIRSQYANNGHLPVISHYANSDPDCPWYDGRNLTPDDARAAQYKGHQESALHRWLCQTLEQLAQQDKRYRKSSIDIYLRPAIHQRGRWPDVLIEFEKLGRVAFEIQLSKPFAPEIAARHIFYEAEGVPLIWVFHELDLVGGELPQGFRDIITMQRGNAFVLDAPAIERSHKEKRLLLNCYLENGRGGFNKPKIVGLDELTLDFGRSVFYVDRRSEWLKEYCKLGRAKWWQALREVDRENDAIPFARARFNKAWDSIRMFVPAMCDWRQSYREQTYGGVAEQHFAELIAILFSIAATAKTGEERLYLTRYKGQGSLIAMLNARISSEEFRSYACLIERMIGRSRAHSYLGRESLTHSIAMAVANAIQVSEGDTVWTAVTRIFPEVFNGTIRAEMTDLDCLPDWASRS